MTPNSIVSESFNEWIWAYTLKILRQMKDNLRSNRQRGLPVRICPICDAIYFKSNPLCKFCENLVMVELLRGTSEFHIVEGIKVYSLFQWKEGESLGIVPELLYRLKGGSCPGLVRWLAELLCLKISPDLGSSLSFVPAPASQFGQSDHARILAQSFVNNFNHSFLFAPLKRKNSLQKQKSLGERKKAKVEVCKSRIRRFQKLKRHRRIILCDDVVTSGSTLRACCESLGSPPQFECWSLAYRKKNLI